LIEHEIERLMKKTVELGGTLTGEHGIGLAKRQYLSLEFDRSTIEYMRLFKKIFDPHAILNPGKIFLK
jgi:FAD/FMN-containing dehydrogenase